MTLQVQYPALPAAWGHLSLQDTTKLDRVLSQPSLTAVVLQVVQKQ